MSIFAALLEGLGLGLLVPIIEIAQGNTQQGEVSRTAELFLQAYVYMDVPFTLGSVITGVALVMVLRYTTSFLVAWFRAILQTDYIRYLQTKGFDHALQAEVAYYDEHGTDEVLNAIVTQTEYASRVIRDVVRLVEQGALSLIYLTVAVIIAPVMTLFTALLLGSVLLFMRYVIESGYSVGDRIANANEKIQTSVQAGTQGIRDVKMFGLQDELFADFSQAVDQYFHSHVKKRRNEAVMNNIYQMLTAISVFVLIYVALSFASLSLAGLGAFLFAMFRLSPRVSTLNNITYRIASDLPHLMRTQSFIDELDARSETTDGSRSPPENVEHISIENVSFAYGDETVLNDVSLEVHSGEFVAFVGQSGAGKSTIVSLLARMYDPDSGSISANGTEVREFDLSEWRDRLSMVRQRPYVFNDTLRYNITVGRRSASEAEIQEVCELAEVTEFLKELPNGLDTVLGDDGVRLSGGQRQRIAIARALLGDFDVLILDEATSDLDTSLEERIQANIEASERGSILLVIAHRLSTVVNADRIYTLADGQIAEVGSHDDLIANGGRYAELYSSES